MDLPFVIFHGDGIDDLARLLVSDLKGVLVCLFKVEARGLALDAVGNEVNAVLLGKLADVIEVAPDLHMVVVDIPAGANLVFIPRIVDFHLAAIRNAKQLLVMAVNKTDSFLCVLQVLIEPIPAIAIAVQVVFASVRVQAQED